MAGFKYIGSEIGGDINGKVKTFSVGSGNGTKLGPMDVVVITGTGTTTGLPTVAIGTANTANTGVVTAVNPSIATEALSQTYLSASTAGTLQVNVDAFALYEADVANGPLTEADIGLNVPLVATEGSVSGSLWVPAMKVNATGKATTATLPFRVVKLLDDDDGTYGGRAVVRVNASTSNIGATGI